MRRGPLIIYDQKAPLCHAFRNLPGIELCSVNRLSLLLLAPGGHVGRFVIYTQSAFKRIDLLYGTYSHPSMEKKGYFLPRPVMANSDLERLLASEEIQSHLRPRRAQPKHVVQKKNPLKNLGFLIKLNPYAKVQRRLALIASHPRVKKDDKSRHLRSQKFSKRKPSPAKEIKKQKRKKNPARGFKNNHKVQFVRMLKSNN